MRKFCLCLPLLLTTAAAAGETLTDTSAFDRAYAASFYQFDGCGDWLAGRTYREALADKLKQCPFSPEARSRFQTRATAQRRKSNEVMEKLIEDNGGLPVRLEGMARTCHEQINSPEYQALHARLETYAAGKSGPDPVVPQPCDATEITP